MTVVFLFSTPVSAEITYDSEEIEQQRQEDDYRYWAGGEKKAAYYELPNETNLLEVTSRILVAEQLPQTIKDKYRTQKRRFFTFDYPSDGLKVKGYISFLPDAENRPLLVFLRGGGQFLGIPIPGDPYLENYTVVCTTYRGGMSEGVDEYGGNDVNDVKNLINYLPQLEKQLGFCFTHNQRFLLGRCRGGLQSALALIRYPFLQKYFEKVAFLSPLFDLKFYCEYSPRFRNYLINFFGLKPGKEEKQWFAHRDPLLKIHKFCKKLPMLILYGEDDNRLHPDHCRNMAKALKKAKCTVELMEIPQANHGLRNCKEDCNMLLSTFFEGDKP
jgi:dipeptidyl aminopeptidase/acylaminoacyl peptidase